MKLQDGLKTEIVILKRTAMLLFSTILDIQDFVTADNFIRLVLEWNESSKYKENRVTDIEWQGEHTARYGNDRLYLEIMEDTGLNSIAIRHVKVSDESVVWDSVFIANFSERKISIQLERTYSEEALVFDAAFSTPHIITLLIEKGFIRDDDGLPVLRTPLAITDDYKNRVKKIIASTSENKLPVVFVTRASNNEAPVSIEWLASRLKGAAHVLVEEAIEKCAGIRKLCGDAAEPYGAVRIFYPSDAVRNKNIFFRSAEGNPQERLEKVIQHVLRYWLSQRIPQQYTWQGVVSDLLDRQLSSQILKRQEAEEAKEKAEDEIVNVYEVFDDDLKSQRERIDELSKANEALLFENQGLRAKLAASMLIPLIFQGEEEDFYPGEIRDMILTILDEAAAHLEEGTRRKDVVEDVLEANPCRHLSEERKKKIKDLFKGYKHLTGTMRQELTSLGFIITEEGKHYKLKYRGDGRYTSAVAKTPSDARSGINCAAEINKRMM